MQEISRKFKKDSENIPTIKLVVIGTGQAGKTSLLKIYSLLMKIAHPEKLLSNATKISNPFEETALFDQTIFGLGTKIKDEKEVPIIKYSLYTVAGQRRYRDACKIVLTGADGLIVLLDPTNIPGNEEALSELGYFLGGKSKVPFTVAINKCDLEDLPPDSDMTKALVESGFVADLSNVEINHISAMSARNALLGLLNVDPKELFDVDGLIRSEHFPEAVSDIVSMVNRLTHKVIESKIR